MASPSVVFRGKVCVAAIGRGLPLKRILGGGDALEVRGRDCPKGEDHGCHVQ